MKTSLVQRTLVATLILCATAVGFATEPKSEKVVREFDNSLYHAKLDEAGQLVSFVVKPFGDDLVIGSYSQKGSPVKKTGGLIFGPVGRMTSNVKLNTTPTKTGGFLTKDPSGQLLPRGLEVERSYSFSEKRYAFDVNLVLRNVTDKTLPLTSSLGDLAFWLGPILPAEPRATQEIVVLKPPNAVETLKLTNELQMTAPGFKWLGARESYYAAIIEEKSGHGSYLYGKVAYEELNSKERQALLIGFKYQYPDLRSKEEVAITFKVYLGPKVEQQLALAGYAPMFNNWNGLTGGIGKLMFETLKLMYRLTGSYGIAILLLTFLVKLLLHPVNVKQLRSMQKMQALQPKLQKLKEKYPDSREFQTEVQKLYVEHDVNPLGGCLPMLFQVPIFIALYSCLLGAIELKKVPFLWMPDLAKPDPWAVLPILFAGSIYFSSKMTSSSQAADPTQQTVMQIMPIMMLMLMMNVPSGVMIYLAGQSLLSMVETRYNQTLLKQEEAAAAALRAEKKKKRKGEGA